MGVAINGFSKFIDELGRVVQHEVFFVFREVGLFSDGQQTFAGSGERLQVWSDDVHGSPPLLPRLLCPEYEDSE